jgi:hypothetical protein
MAEITPTQPIENNPQNSPLVPLEKPPGTTPLVPLEKPRPHGKTVVKSLEELKAVDAEMYNEFMTGIGMNICGDIRRHDRHFKEAMKEADRESKRR